MTIKIFWNSGAKQEIQSVTDIKHLIYDDDGNKLMLTVRDIFSDFVYQRLSLKDIKKIEVTT